LKKVTLGALGCVIALLLIPSAASAQSVGGCQLDGNASFTPGLTNNAQNFQYSFNGSLSGCQSSEPGAPTSGTVSAGEIVTIAGQQFQEPVPSGNGSCGSSTTAGTAIATWADGTQTVIDYSTTGAAAAVHLEGTVANSVTLQAVNPQPGQPTSTTVTTTRYAGDSSQGLLTFQPPDPTACATLTGVTTAGISGIVGLGSSS
jgi:hypothetical protein